MIGTKPIIVWVCFRAFSTDPNIGRSVVVPWLVGIMPALHICLKCQVSQVWAPENTPNTPNIPRVAACGHCKDSHRELPIVGQMMDLNFFFILDLAFLCSQAAVVCDTKWILFLCTVYCVSHRCRPTSGERRWENTTAFDLQAPSVKVWQQIRHKGPNLVFYHREVEPGPLSRPGSRSSEVKCCCGTFGWGPAASDGTEVFSWQDVAQFPVCFRFVSFLFIENVLPCSQMS